jgi:hypothetical protein
VELSDMGFLVALVTWDRKNHASIFKQFGVFTQCMLSDEKIHDLIILLPGNDYFFLYKDSKSAAYSVCFVMNRKTTVLVGNVILVVEPVLNRLND